MLAIENKILNKQILKFNINLKLEQAFFKKPLSLVALNTGAIAALNVIADNLLNDFKDKVDIDFDNLHKLKNFLKTNPVTDRILSYASESLNDDIVSEMLLKCETINDANAEEFIGTDFFGDLLDKISQFKNKAEKLLNQAAPYIYMGIFAYYIVKMVIDLFQNTEFPSTFRLKYIQKLIRVSLSTIWDSASAEFSKIKGFLTKIDELLITIGTASALYLFNKAKSQKLAEKKLKDNMCPEYVYDIPLSDSISRPFEINLECPVKDPDTLVPKKPFSDDEVVCVKEEPTQNFDISQGVELATKAIIENKKDLPLIPTLAKGDLVTDRTVIANIGGQSLYSPVNGHIDYYKDNKVALRDISDPSDEFIASTINSLNESYKELNDIKMFLTDWQVVSLYPVMLQASPVIDSSASTKDSKGIKNTNVEKEFDKIKGTWADINKNYEKRIKKITGKDNIKTNAENETLYKIKEEVDKENKLIHSYLASIQDNAIKIGKQTIPNKGEMEMIEYYLGLSLLLNSIKEPDSLTKEYRTKINEFLRQRYVIDGWKPAQIAKKGNDLLDKLEKGITLGNWFKKGLEIYAKRKKISDVEDWLKDLGNKNKKLDVSEKNTLIAKIKYLYEFYLESKAITEKYKDLKESDKKKQINIEGRYIKNYFTKLLIRFVELPVEILTLEKTLEDLSLLGTYALTDINEEQYRVYTIKGDEVPCKIKGIDDRELDLGSLKYWLKWCSYATLMSVANPATGWSTGFILPTGPLLLPTVYIPIKPLETKYGVILLGLTITGIYIFPLALFTNYSSQYAFPIADPTQFIKEQIQSLKANISEELNSFKKETLKLYLKDLIDQVDQTLPEIGSISNDIKAHNENKPPQTKKFAKENIEWKAKKIELKAKDKELKLKKYAIEKKYKIIEDAANFGGKIVGGTNPTDAALTTIEKTEEAINKQFEALDALVDKANKLAGTLPITLKPMTTNFSATIKNIPSPNVFKTIDDDLDETVNEGAIDKMFKPFKLNNEGFMKGPVEFAEKTYNTARNVAKVSMINKEPFPAYEDLKVTNLAWMKFLNTKFVPTGAKTYGIPGMPPYPI